MNIQRIHVESENPLHHWNWLNVENQVVLDLGCGFHFIEDGWDTTPEFFLKKGASKIIGLDPHLDDIEHFKQILSLESWLAPGALVGMDDTYLFNDCWIGNDTLKERGQFGEFGSVVIDSILHQVVARWAIAAASLTVVFILLAPVTASTFDVIAASALTVWIVALKR